MTNSTIPDSIGLIGFGAFGRLMARHLSHRFRLTVFDPALNHDASHEPVTISDVATVARCPVVILAPPVDQLAAALAAIRPHLQPGAVVLDVCSVKVEPTRLMTEMLPPFVDIVGTHPLFGPQSAAGGIKGLKIALCPVRGDRTPRIAAYLRAALGLKVYICTPEEHDRNMAVVQGLTHLIAKLFVQMEPLPKGMTTKSYDLMLRAVDMVRHDSAALFRAVEQCNPYAAPVRKRFFALAEALSATLSSGE